ncbi:MAG: bifunctional aspartate kinase/diaminopimelate decarboxylase [Deltaproteobacteria bacterium]|nr:bifunctional aspartate kinase/diaminopimelate decarboxylase [Deltaproteobacteria bacterium]
MSYAVIKFGGTSVTSLKCWQTIREIAVKRLETGLKPVIVCSATAKTSDLLEKLIAGAIAGDYREFFESIKERHLSLAKELGVGAKILSPYFEEIDKLAKGVSLIHEASPKVKAKIMAYGELLSTKLGSAYLNANGVDAALLDARDLLASEERKFTNINKHYLSAACVFEKDDVLIKKISDCRAKVILTQGFIARDEANDTVLLGRGGSDVSAAYFAAKLAAARCEIWTDVCGVFTANPRHMPEARLLKALDYDEAQEIVSLGAKVLHPRCIAPLKKHSIPIYVYALDYPDRFGTIISAEAKQIQSVVKAVSSKIGVTVISMETVEMWQEAGFLAEIFACFKKHGLSIDLVSTSESSVTVTLDRTANVLDKTTLDKLTSELEAFCNVNIIHMAGIVSLVGRGIRAIIHKLGSALEAFEEHKIYLVSQASNDLNLTFVVDEDCVERLVKSLHGELFQMHSEGDLFGPTWQEIISEKAQTRHFYEKWWVKSKKELLKLAEKTTPLFVYDEETIRTQIKKLQKLKSIDKIFYSVKANWHPEILKALYKNSSGFECVSAGEIKHILKLFPKIDRRKILFTPNFVGGEEYKFAFSKGVNVTVDNIYPLLEWKHIFNGREIFVRIDPGEGRGHHKFVHTAGAKSKFGIYPSQIDILLKHAAKNGIKIKGLHAHVGSNIFKTDTWASTTAFLIDTAKQFKDVKIIDIGGGLGIAEKPAQNQLDIEDVEEKLSAVKKAGYEIWIEPGRFLVAEAGVILAKVTQTKQKGDYNFVGLNVGMNSLIRPALYGAYHEIVNLSRFTEKPSVIANIVGPICESGDVLGASRYIAEPRDGDIFLIGTAGAYGRSMSSSYNLRPPAEEYFRRAKYLFDRSFKIC